MRKVYCGFQGYRFISYSISAVILTLALEGCGPNSMDTDHSKIKSAWDSSNSPNRMDPNFASRYQYRKNFSELPLSGSLTKTPWSDHYWPTYKGGISYRWNDIQSSDLNRYGYRLLTQEKAQNMSLDELKKISPAEKFDLLLGAFHFPFTRAERKRTQILRTVPGNLEYTPGFKIPAWEGLCHGLMPAILKFEEPNPITVVGVSGQKIPFGSSDIKALLAYFYHSNNSRTYFLGNRCEYNLSELESDYRNGRITKDVYEKNRRDCADTNAGAFHLVLTNQIALLDEGFIVDKTREKEVWNQSVYRYDSQVLGQRTYASPGAAPGTVREVEVKTTMFYVNEINQNWEANSDKSESEATATYRYRLELNANNEIIGGEWASERADRPDFLWKQSMPKFSGVWKYLEKIYSLSVVEKGDIDNIIVQPPEA